MTSLCRLLSAAGLASWAATVAAAVMPAPGPSFPNTAGNCNNWYLAKSGDDCSKAVAAGGITSASFFQWNPDVSKDCTVNFWPDFYYCIGVDANAPTRIPSSTSTTASSTPATTSSIPSTTSKSTSLTTTSTQNETYSIRFPIATWNITTPTRGTIFPPKETKPGQPSYCIDWHYVDGGDTCLTIANIYDMQVDDLLNWNPTLGDDCSGLTIQYWLCIRIQPQTSLTLTYGSATAPVSVPEGTPWTPTTWPAVDTSFTVSPTQGPLAENCGNFYMAVDGDRCTNVLEKFPMMTREQFFTWNSFLGGNCDGLWTGFYYCVFAGSQNDLPDPATATTKPATGLAPGVSSDCVRWYQTSGGDDCNLVVAIFSRFSLADFLSWNPSVGSDCAGIQDDLYYCVAVSSTPTTRTVALPPFPTDEPGNGTTTATDGPTTTTESSGTATVTSSPSTTSSGTVATPTPVQDGMVNGCKRFYFVVSGDGCWAISNAAGIQLSDFYKWNPAIDSVCSNLMPGYYVCTGL